MTLPEVDTERFTLVREHLYTPVLGDVLDQLGRTHQFLPQGIQALHPDMVLVGRAMPLLITDVFETQRSPFGRLTEALDQLEPGDVYLARSGRAQCAAWGEILTVTARARGAAGAVIDGFHRDTVRILEQNWPVFSRGRFAQDAGVRASVVDYRVPLEIDGVRVNPGDLIVGDIDGVVVVPSAVENEVLELALAKATAENMVRQAIEGGMSSTTAFATYGVL
jgi:4-hydroxy-4-methyl-2-oxoglutarate aldolase